MSVGFGFRKDTLRSIWGFLTWDMNSLFQEIIWVLTDLDYKERWFVGGLFAPVHWEAFCTVLYSHSWSCSAAQLSARLRSGGNAHPSPVGLPKLGTRRQGRQAHFFGRFLTALSRLPLCSHSTPCMMYVKIDQKLRPIPRLWCCSEVRRIARKIDAPPPFSFPWKKKKKVG